MEKSKKSFSNALFLPSSIMENTFQKKPTYIFSTQPSSPKPIDLYYKAYKPNAAILSKRLESIPSSQLKLNWKLNQCIDQAIKNKNIPNEKKNDCLKVSKCSKNHSISKMLFNGKIETESKDCPYDKQTGSPKKTLNELLDAYMRRHQSNKDIFKNFMEEKRTQLSHKFNSSKSIDSRNKKASCSSK